MLSSEILAFTRRLGVLSFIVETKDEDDVDDADDDDWDLLFALGDDDVLLFDRIAFVN